MISPLAKLWLGIVIWVEFVPKFTAVIAIGKGRDIEGRNVVNITSVAVYLGGGIVTLFPKMNIQGKDFNPFQGAGKQFKLSFIDFQMDANLLSPAITATTVQLFVNSYLGEQANLINTNQELINSSQACGFITFATQANPCQHKQAQIIA